MVYLKEAIGGGGFPIDQYLFIKKMYFTLLLFYDNDESHISNGERLTMKESILKIISSFSDVYL